MTHSVAAAACLAATLLAAGAAQAQSATYAIEPTHTFVSFEVSHFGTSTNRGRFDKKEGTVQFDRAGKTGRVEINIDTTSINSGVAQFDSHLKSKDFFNAAEHPTARFVGDSFVFDGESDVLRNAEDPHTAGVFDPAIRGHTDQFMLRFRKPD